MMNCLTNIIGILKDENECITGGLTNEQIAEMKLSTSGLYLDDLEGGVHLKAVKHADATRGLYQMGIDARNNAIKRLEDDLIIQLNLQHSKSRKNFNGEIGRRSFSQSLAVTGEWNGLRLRPVDYSDAVITLRSITNIISLAASYNIYLWKVPYKAAMGTIIRTFPAVSTAPNTFHTLYVDQSSGGLRLPLVENGEQVEYWLVWSKIETGGALPKNNKLACSTCDRSNGGAPYGEFLIVNGVDLADMSNLQAAAIDEYSHGLSLDVLIKCDSEKLFCTNYDENDAVALTMAYATWFKAGELLIEGVLKSPDISRYTTMDKTRLLGKRNKFKAEYDGRIPFLINTIDVTASNCYICREQINQPFHAGIFS